MLILLAAWLGAAWGEELLLGYLTGSQRLPGDQEYSRPGLTISGAISLAVNEINRGILRGTPHSLRFLVAETYGDESHSIRQTAELWTANVTGYIGPQETCVHEAKMAAAFNLPMISYFCTHYETSDKAEYPTFARTRPPDTQISKSVASVLLHFNWTQVTFFYLNSTETDLTPVAQTILDVLERWGVRVLATRTWSQGYHHGYMENPFRSLVAQTYRYTRIYLILGQYYEHLGLLVALEEKNLLETGEYWVVGVDLDQYDRDEPAKYLMGLLQDEPDPVALRGFRSYLGLSPSPSTGLENFTVAVNRLLEEPPFSFPNPVRTVGGVKLIRSEAAYLYDAVKLYTRAALEILREGGDVRNGTDLINRMKEKHYTSAMGYEGYMDRNGDAEGNYTLLARKTGPDGQLGLYPVGVFAYTSPGGLPVLQLTSAIDWVKGSPPIAEPPCGFLGQKCVSHTMEIAGGVAGACAALVILVLLGVYRNLRYEQELDSLLWKIDYRDIELEGVPEVNTKGLQPVEMRSADRLEVGHAVMRTSQVSLTSNPDFDFRYSSIYTTVGKYRGRMFAIKKVDKKSIDITRSMKKELKIMRDLRHDNINAFIGACTEPPNICIVTEYCHRGSLKDILENEDVKLDGMFKASLVGDIIQGLNFLHDSAVKVHGNLKTSNCLVDSRWVVKLSDFGLSDFKSPPDLWSLKHFCSESNSCLCHGLLYRAPELLQVESGPFLGTQKGDIYSFGIVLYEIHSRRGPYGDCTGLSPRQILQRLMYPNSPEPIRPPLEQLDEDCLECVRDCLKDCWSEDPDLRPDIRTVRSRLRPMRKGMKANIFDNMIALMEKYSTNLEALVDERTDQLVEEKKKTDALLYEMLPKYVAEQLKKGHKVEAESFDSVTIYFSDIVGFTSMSAESTPLQIPGEELWCSQLQRGFAHPHCSCEHRGASRYLSYEDEAIGLVVDFLNDLYTCFDSIIEAYDVYKVETIGDAYMVCSGCPIRNGDQHAAEIATMALDILNALDKFRIKHRPNEKLKIRIGIHSGSVCAGVVGQKMPRYCLFGDTVNTASRMESNGIAQKIHCSEETKKLLERLGGYHLEERGLVELKGKGEQKTYFLLWEDSAWREHRRAVRRGCGLRSSLKTKLSRASSFESPKRLRFAANHKGDNKLEVIADSPAKRKALEVTVCEDLSASCPCFEKTDRRNELQIYQNESKGNLEALSDPALFIPEQINTPLLSISEVA